MYLCVHVCVRVRMTMHAFVRMWMCVYIFISAEGERVRMTMHAFVRMWMCVYIFISAEGELAIRNTMTLCL